MNTKEYKVVFSFEDGELGTCSAIEYQGALWLVPKWLSFPERGYAKPERMIPLAKFQCQRFDPPATNPGPLHGCDFGLIDPLPKALFLGELTDKLKTRYGALDEPDVRVRLAGVRH
jgi:hypothetical protein